MTRRWPPSATLKAIAPFTRPVLTEIDGVIGFEDLVEGVSMSEQVDEATGIAKRIVTDWRSTPRTAGLKPALVIKGKDGKIAKLARGGDARYLLSVESIISFEPGATVRAGDVIARISINSAKTRDITGGLPRVAELFEARRPKDHAIIAEISGTVRFGKDFKNKQRLTIEPSEEGVEAVEHLIPKSKHIHLQDGDVIEKGEYIVDGNPAPHDILAIKGVEELAAYLVNEIQEVYRLQGVSINDKHIEVIVRQMLQKVDITDAGDTDFLIGEQVDASDLEAANEAVTAEGKKAATGVPVLLGITKASLQTRSFISAASFQETTRVLTEAAVNGKVDTLEGLKENVIVGRLIPAGTGAAVAKLRSDRGDARHLDPGAEGGSSRGGSRPASRRPRRRAAARNAQQGARACGLTAHSGGQTRIPLPPGEGRLAARQHLHRPVELRIGAGGVARVELDLDGRLDADPFEALAVHQHVLDREQEQPVVADQERGRGEHGAFGALADQFAEPVFLEPIGEHLLAAAGALIDQHRHGLAPFDVDEPGFAGAILDLHRRRARIEQIEILRLGAAPSAAQIPDERVGILERPLADEVLEGGLIPAAGIGPDMHVADARIVAGDDDAGAGLKAVQEHFAWVKIGRRYADGHRRCACRAADLE